MDKPPRDGLVLVAVSGGSDSTALIYRLAETIGVKLLFATTVDHGLRKEARQEAESVGIAARKLGVLHRILTWRPDTGSAEGARLARYDLLARYAREIGAGTIALGHTLDDQAETVLMRALRAKPETGTIGLSGMNPLTHYEDLILWRPLLDERRENLRNDLRRRNVVWIDDPTNSDNTAERVRIRAALDLPGLPDRGEIARLAALLRRDRHWLARQTAKAVRARTIVEGSKALIFKAKPALPPRLLREVVSVLVMTVGGLTHRPSVTTINDIVAAIAAGQRFKKAVGRALVRVEENHIHLEREQRHIATPPAGLEIPFARFRAASDDPVHEAIADVIGSGHST